MIRVSPRPSWLLLATLGACTEPADQANMLDCRLRLAFSPQAVVIETEPGHGECGFGQGVSADEMYRRTSAAVPAYFTDATVDKTFSKKRPLRSIMRKALNLGSH